MQGQNSRKCKRIQASHDSNRLKSQFEKNISTIRQRTATRHSTFYVKIKDINHYESLLLSKLDYCNELSFDIPKYMKQQVQKLKNAVTGLA